MTGTDPNHLASRVRALAHAADPAGGLPDAELVRRYADARDAAAFEVLVWRHGPMVWGTCARVLRHRQDAEDAFQATFLALARSARAVGRGPVGGWLHRVAANAALKLRARRRPTAELPDVPGEPAPDRELAGVLDQELDRLPAHHRAAFVLCCLEGLTNAEAARELGCPVGTVDSRLHAARTRLRDRLARRGFAPAALAVAATPVPPATAAATIALGTHTQPPPPAVDRLANQIGGTMFRLPAVIGMASAALAAVAVAAWAIDGQPPPADPPRPAPVPAARPPEKAPALLFTELITKPGETGSRTIRLTRATFRDGKLTARDALDTGDASGFGYGAHYRVIGNRYVVYQSATVFDLAETKVRHTFDGGQVIAVGGTSVYFFSGKDGAPEGVFRYDVATGVRDKVAGPGEGRWGLRGIISPGGTKSIGRELRVVEVLLGSELPYDILLNQVGKQRVNLGEFRATMGATGGGAFDDAPPGVWLDDDQFLTQTTLGKVVAVNTATKAREPVADIPLAHRPGEKAWDDHGVFGFTPLGFQQPRFSRLPDGRVRYDADRVYLIDVAKKTWEKAEWLPLGHGFEYSAEPERVKTPGQSGRVARVELRHNGKVIGTSETVWWTTPEKPRAVAGAGYLAVVERATRPGAPVPSDEVRVWSAATGAWQTIDAWTDALVGWVE